MGILKKFTRFLKEGADAADSHDKLERVVEQEEEEEELISVNDESDGQIQENDVLLAFLSKLLRIRTSQKKAQRYTKLNLNWKEYISITFYLQLPLGYWVRHVEIVKKYGASLVLISDIVIGLTLGMPLYVIYKILGNYSRKSYIKMWDSVPILKGVAYSVGLYSTAVHTFDIAVSGLALLYISKLLGKDIPWSDCQFDETHMDCMKTFVDNRDEKEQHYHGLTCCNEYWPNCSWIKQSLASAKYSTIDYYMGHILEIGYDSQPAHDGLNTHWVAPVIIIWILIFLMMSVGLRKFRSIMTAINILIFMMLVPILLGTLYESPEYATVPAVNSDYDFFFDYVFWITTTLSQLNRELPGDLVMFSSVSHPSISSTVDTIIIYALKIGFIMLLTVWLSIGATVIQQLYNIQNSLCVQIEGDILIFAMIPDLLQRLPMAQFWLIVYFFVIAYWGFSVSAYVCNAFLESLIEEYPKLTKWRTIMSACFCIAIGTINVFMLRPNFMEQFKQYMSTTAAQAKAVIIFVSLIGLAIYTVGRVRTDYHFYTGIILPTFWIQGAKIAILLVAGVCILSFIHKWPASNYRALLIPAILPIFVGMLLVTIEFIKKKRKTLVEPDPSWGPPSYKVRLARLRFDPTYQLRHRSITIECKHYCLKDSFDLRKEIRHWRQKKEGIDEIYRKLHLNQLPESNLATEILSLHK